MLFHMFLKMSEADEELFTVWKNKFKLCKYIDEAFEIFKNIGKALKSISNPYNVGLVFDKELCDFFASYATTFKDLQALKLYHQTFLKLCLSFERVDIYETVFSDDLFENCSLKIHAKLQNYNDLKTSCNPNQLEQEVMQAFIQSSGKYSPNSKYFSICIENYIQILDLNLIGNGNHSRTFACIFNNLENPYRNVHDLLLKLFSKLILHEAVNSEEIINEILIQIPWISAKKYYLLNSILEVDHPLLTDSTTFNQKQAINGVCVALKYRNLLSPSRLLMKTILKKSLWKEELLDLFVDILKSRSEFEQRNFLIHWYNLLGTQFNNDLYQKLAINATMEHHHLIIFRSIFWKQMNDHPKVGKIDNIIDSHVDTKDSFLKLKILTIYVENATNKNMSFDTFLARQLVVWKFIKTNMTFEDSSFREDMLKKIPSLLESVANRKPIVESDIKKLLSYIENEIFYPGIKSNDYQPLKFTIKFLNILLEKFYFNGSGDFDESYFGCYFAKLGWNLLDEVVFQRLIELLANEFNDVRETALKLLVKYFAQNCYIKVDDMTSKSTNFPTFSALIKDKIESKLNETDIDAANTAHLYFQVKLAHEYSEIHNLFRLMEHLDENFKKFHDPVAAVTEGKNLFNIINCLGQFFLKRHEVNGFEEYENVSFVTHLKFIVNRMLELINIEGKSPNFDIQENSLWHLMETSDCDIKDPNTFKKKLLLAIWYTLKACSDSSVILAEVLFRNTQSFNYGVDIKKIYGLFEINYNILMNCCHKGAIEAAGNAIGKITKLVTRECSRFVSPKNHLDWSEDAINLLIRKINLSRNVSGEHLDIRCVRGSILLFHHIVRGDSTKGKIVFEYAIGTFFTTLEDAKQTRFLDETTPLHIHQLAAIVKDSELIEQVMSYMDNILVATFEGFKKYSSDWSMKNALLQLIGAIIPKIANQKQLFLVVDEMDYEPRPITIDELQKKLPYSFDYAVTDLSSKEQLPPTYLIVLLEYFSHFEAKSCNLEKLFERFLGHENEKIRYLSSKCFAQLLPLDESFSCHIINKTNTIFTTKNENLAHSYVLTVIFMLKRLESCLQFMDILNHHQIVGRIQAIVRERYKELMETKFSFFFRSYLLKLLAYLQFDANDPITRDLMLKWPAKNNFGFNVFKDNLSETFENLVIASNSEN